VPRPDATAVVKRDVDRDLTAGRARLRKRIDDRQAYDAWTPAARRILCHFNNVASAIRVDVLAKLPFRALAFGEDLDFGKRALEAGHTIAFAPDAVVVHSHASGWAKDFHRQALDARVEYELFGIDRPRSLPAALARWLRLTTADLTGTSPTFAPALRLAQALGKWRGVAASRGSR
jgi:rhamnosyltransferase